MLQNRLNFKKNNGIAALPTMLLIGSIIAEIGIAGAFISYLYFQSSFGIRSSFDNLWNSDSSAINFRTKVSGATTNAMTIKGNGNVGIGTTAPENRLTVKQESGNTAQLKLE